MRKKKGAMELDLIGWWALGIGILAIVLWGLFILKGKGVGGMQYLSNLFRFGK